MIHYDLFAGIGGFSLAVDEVFKDEPVKHVFCEWDGFCTAVLKKHWPDAEFCGDIAELVAHTEHKGLEGRLQPGDSTREDTARSKGVHGSVGQLHAVPHLTIVTGGFPCQPFSAAGRRRGTADDRYKWPEMFAVIRNVKPDWVVAENVRGLVTWNDGMVLEQVCAGLESEGYEVQPFIIPAVAVNAPHRRDRVWIIAHRESERGTRERLPIQQGRPQQKSAYPDWSRDWREVAFASCDGSLDDGLSRDMGGLAISYPKYRKEALKALGNSIVPQVAIQIMKAIKETI